MLKAKEEFWRLKFWQVPYLGYLGLLHGSHITYKYPRHLHREYSVALMLAGKETTTCRNKSFAAFPGNIILINAEEAHDSDSINTEYRIFKIPARTLTQIACDVTHPAKSLYFPKLVIEDNLVFRLLLDLHVKLEQQGSRLEHESQFVHSVGLLLARHSGANDVLRSPTKEPQYVKVAREYIRAHYADNISLAKLTSLTTLSPFHLIRVFGRQVGCPPHEYQTQVRIEQARKLIREGHSILDVALATGFVDQSHFSRHFKRIVGIPPGQYSHSKIIQDTKYQSLINL
jgi:AraC-like DNA-binding protein